MLSLSRARPRALYASIRSRTNFSHAGGDKRKGFWRSKQGYAVGGALGVSTAIGIWAWCKADKDRPLSIHSFSPVTILSSEKTGTNTKLVRLKIPDRILPGVSFPPPIWSVFVKDSDIQIERPFTPLEGASEDGALDLWVKKYSDSEMGRWIHSRPVGESVEIRGPHQTWAWKEDTWDRVVMIAGGTGVTPFHQLLHHVFSKGTKHSPVEFVLLHAYRSMDEIPPPAVMDNFSKWSKANPNKLKISTFVEGETSGSYQDGKVTESAIREALATDDRSRTLVLICGPDRMINALAGPKTWDGSQGPVGGVLGKIPGKFEVWKL